MRLKPQHHKILYLTGLLLIAVGLPLSRALMSIGMMWVAGSWLLSGDFKAKWTRLKGIPAVWIFVSIYVLHLLGLAWTNDFDYALKDLRIKLPMLFFPLVVASNGNLPRLHWRILEGVFIAALFVGTCISTAVWLGWTWHTINDIRDISLFISHIRFGLLIAVAVFLLLRHLLVRQGAPGQKLGALLLVLWFLCFLVILQAFTALLALLVTGYLFMLRAAWRQSKPRVKWSLGLVLLLVPLVFGSYMMHEVRSFLPLNEPPWENLEAHSPRGEGYLHAPDRPSVESGRYVFRYVAHEELKTAWEARSSISIDSLDLKGNHMKTTVLRYMTSRGLRKDLDGVAQLRDDEIKAIESGVANERFLHGNGFSNRIYKVIWQWYYYSIGHNPEGNSVTQRMEFWKTGWWIACNHWVMGVGTGDVPSAFEEAYQATDTELKERYRYRAHNQYLTILLTFGVPGFLWFLLALWLPPVLEGRMGDFSFLAFFTIATVSMINEDTIETQAGVTFVVFLYCMLLWARPIQRYPKLDAQRADD